MLTLSSTFDGRRTIPSLAITELMLELLKLKSGGKLLEIGTGSGSQTQRYAATGAEVHSIELEPWVDPTVIVGECVFLHSGNGENGLPSEAPFTAIVASCGVEEIPPAWIKQLTEGGKLVAPIGDVRGQRLTMLRKEGFDLVPERVVAYVRFQMLRKPPEQKPVKPRYVS